MTNQFTHAIAIKPLGLMYASTGAFLSPENLVGASNNKFPPDAPTLSGIYAAHYGKGSDELDNLQLAGSFWGKEGAESDFYVPTPFNYLVLKGQDRIIAGLIPLDDRWRLPNGTLPPEEKYVKHSWLRLSDWQYLNNFEGNVPRTTTGKAIAVASDPWQSLPHLHPRLDKDQRIVYNDENSNLGSLYLENAVQLPDDVCLIYLANVPLPEGWYRFGGEGHLVEITSHSLSEQVTQLLNQPLGKTFALISPGVWGTNRFSFLEPRTLVRESGKPDSEMHENLLSSLSKFDSSELEILATQLEEQGEESTAKWLQDIAKKQAAIEQAQTTLIDSLDSTAHNLGNLAKELKSGNISSEAEEMYAVVKSKEGEQLKFINQVIKIILEGGKESDIHNLLEQKFNLVDNRNPLFILSLFTYIDSYWEEYKSFNDRLTCASAIAKFLAFISSFNNISWTNDLDDNNTIGLKGYEYILIKLGDTHNIWQENENKYCSTQSQELLTRIAKVDYVINKKGNLDINNSNYVIYFFFRDILYGIGNNLFSLFIQGKNYFESLNADYKCILQCLQSAIKISEMGDFKNNQYVSDRWAQTQTLLGNAYMHSNQGNQAENIDRAINCYEKALGVYSPIYNPINWLIVQRSLGSAYKNRIRGKKPNNLRKALEFYSDEVLEVIKSTESLEKWALTLRNRGNIYTEYAEHSRSNKSVILSKAVDSYQKAIKAYEQQNLPEEQALTQMFLIEVYWQQAQRENANNKANVLEKVIECCEEVLNFYNHTQFPQKWATTQTVLGSAYLEYSKVHKDRLYILELAVTHFQNALRVITKKISPLNYVGVLSALGQAYQDLRQYDKADNAFEDSIQTLESLGSNLLQDSATEEDKQKFAETYSDPYLSIIPVCIKRASINDEPQHYLKAIEYVERSKARNLVQLLANKSIYPKPELYSSQQENYQSICNELDELRRKIPALQRQLQLLENNSEEAQQLHQLLNELQQQKASLLELINKVDQDFKFTQAVQPISFKQMQSLCGEQEVILEWYIAYEQFFLFIISPKSKTPIVWQYSQQEYKDFSDLVYEYFTDYNKYLKDNNPEWKSKLSDYLHRLAQILHIEEIIERYLLPLNCQQLILIPHRTLHVFPLHALPLVFSNCYLLDKFPQGVRYAPSCQLLQGVKLAKLSPGAI